MHRRGDGDRRLGLLVDDLGHDEFGLRLGLRFRLLDDCDGLGDRLRRDRLDYFDPMDAPEIPAEDEGADRRIDMQVREDRIRASLEGLPEEQLSLVRMAFFDDLSHSEIAEKTGLPLGTVKSRIRLAFTKLRRSLEANGVIDAG